MTAARRLAALPGGRDKWTAWSVFDGLRKKGAAGEGTVEGDGRGCPNDCHIARLTGCHYLAASRRIWSA
jgi:hypothetical protein